MKGSSVGAPNLCPTLWKKPRVAKTYYPSLGTERQTGTCENFMQTLTSSPTHSTILQCVQATVKNVRHTVLLRQLLALINAEIKET